MSAHSQKITPVVVGSTVGKTVRVLARIPHTSSQSLPATALPLPVGDPAQQVLVVEEPSVGLETLPLVAELSIRPDPSSAPQPSGNSYFVDVGHSQSGVAAEPASLPEASLPEKSSQPTSTSNHRSRKGSRRRRQHLPRDAQRKPSNPTMPKGWATNLPQLHARLMPYSGLIVSLALVASASLLYWLVLGPTSAPVDYQELFTANSSDWPTLSNNSQVAMPTAGSLAESNREMVFQPEATVPEAALPDFSVPTNGLFSAGSESEVQLFVPADAVETPAEDSQLAKVESDELGDAQESVLEGVMPPSDKRGDFLEPLFPTTDFAPLDFSLIGVPTPAVGVSTPAVGVSTPAIVEKNSEPAPQVLPSIANRNLQAPSSPVRR